MADHCSTTSDADLAGMGAREIEDCGLDSVELLVLGMLRHFCLNYSSPNSHAWRGAFRRAELAVGAIDGPVLAYRVSDFLESLRSERGQPFSFVDPRCETCAARIFPAELSSVMLLRGVLREDARIQRLNLAAVVEAGEGHSTIASAVQLGNCINNIEALHEFSSAQMTSVSLSIH